MIQEASMRKISFLLGLVLLTFVIGMGSWYATPKKDSAKLSLQLGA